jgi:uncharacterized protein YndB with AHSA1/START domain
MEIDTLAVQEFAAPIETVFDRAVDHRQFSRFMKKTGPIPGIADAEIEGGKPPAVGAHRRVKMTDGSVMMEEILALDRPSRHQYRWLNRPAFPFSLLVRGAEATWTFVPAGNGSRIEWRYRFELTSPLVYPLAAPVVAIFRRWMANALLAMVKA